MTPRRTDCSLPPTRTADRRGVAASRLGSTVRPFRSVLLGQRG